MTHNNRTNNQFLTIAIDGPAASGKGSLARALADYFKFSYLDTGALYRRVALQVIQKSIDPEDTQKIVEIAQGLTAHDGCSDNDLRCDTVGTMASIIARIQSVRDALMDYQRNFPKQSCQKGYKGSILDGRDIGTIIAPQADIKFFVTAKLEIRAERRYKELLSKGNSCTYSTVLAEMRERDERDSVQLDAHLTPDHQKQENFFLLDSSDLNAQQALDHAVGIVKNSL